MSSKRKSQPPKSRNHLHSPSDELLAGDLPPLPSLQVRPPSGMLSDQHKQLSPSHMRTLREQQQQHQAAQLEYLKAMAPFQMAAAAAGTSQFPGHNLYNEMMLQQSLQAQRQQVQQKRSMEDILRKLAEAKQGNSRLVIQIDLYAPANHDLTVYE